MEDTIPFNLMHSTCLYFNKQQRYDFSKCVLNSKFSHFKENYIGISFITSLYMFIELSLYKIDCSIDSCLHIDV